jgi:hypothetical protein
MSTAANKNLELIGLAERLDIAPHRCARCGNTAATGLDWAFGYDNGTDPNYVGYQCRTCGHIQGLTRGTILRRSRNA